MKERGNRVNRMDLALLFLPVIGLTGSTQIKINLKRPCYVHLYTYGGMKNAFFLILSALFLSLTSTAQADCAPDEEPTSENTDTEKGRKSRRSGCS